MMDKCTLPVPVTIKFVHLDADGNMVKVIGRPNDKTYTDAKFLPQKLVVDGAKRIFAQVQNVNKGFLEFDDTGDFTGFVGASEVTYDFLTYLWKLVATKMSSVHRWICSFQQSIRTFVWIPKTSFMQQSVHLMEL